MASVPQNTLSNIDADIAARIPQLLVAIRKLIQTCPLEPVIPGFPPQEFQSHPYPLEKFGHILLPLWKQNELFYPGSEHWPAFTEFLQALSPILCLLNLELQILQPATHKEAEDHFRFLFVDSGFIQPTYGMNCFRSVRLSADLALEPALPETNHPSDTVAVLVVGNFTGGALLLPDVNERKEGQGLVFCSATLRMGSEVFVGEIYQLQFFVAEPQLE
ncbi:hypothetical protein N431DRAFT_449541 [Stipitochalara longipes BDJ]|nr:hypothetical protein N431DRAFT_449541 [Stipitochalara longipes BDJ]